MFVSLWALVAFAEEGMTIDVPLSLEESEESPKDAPPETSKPEKKEEAGKAQNPEKKREEKKEAKPPNKEALPKSDKKEQKPRNVNPAEGGLPHIIIGLETGAALNTTELQAAFLPVFHVGLQFPYWNERLGILIHGSYHVSGLEASGTSSSMSAESYSYNFTQYEGEFGFNLRVRIPEVPVVTPEIQLGPTVQLVRTEMEGKSGEGFPSTMEQQTRMGVHAALLGSYPLPVGRVIGGVHYTAFGFNNTIQGDAWSHNISPMVGYRYRFF